MSRYKLECHAIEGMLKYIHARVGVCRDDQGRNYIDLGVGGGLGLYVGYVQTQQERDVFQISAQGTLAAFGTDQVSSMGESHRSGVGFPIGGVSIDANLLIPPVEDWLFPRHPRDDQK